MLNYHATQKYYLTFVLQNIDASPCGESVSSVQILQQGNWRGHDQYYYEDGLGDRYAFLHTGVDFDQMFPISVRIVMSSAREITLWGVITDLGTSSTFSTTG